MGSGNGGSGKAGSGKAGSGKAGSGKAGSGKGKSGIWCSNGQHKTASCDCAVGGRARQIHPACPRTRPLAPIQSRA
ncbi:hypothetical protein YH64_020060 [Achromobacter sp. LC458]|nr:hypothetical protein YH64_020060 [Achromobacter sp. LC458]